MAIASGTAALIAAGVAAAGSVASSAISASGAKSAASTAAGAADRSAAMQEAAALRVREDLTPFRETGYAANNRLMQIFGLTPSRPAAPVQQVQSRPGTTVVMPGGQVQLRDGYQYIPASQTDGGESGLSYNAAMLIDKDGNLVAANPDAQTLSRYSTAQPDETQPVTTTETAPSSDLPQGQWGPFQAPTEFTMTPEALAKTPGYQFALDQGLRALNSRAAARGGLLSGRVLKEGIRFATGLADNTYQTQEMVFGNNYNRAQNQFQTNISPLLSLAQLGQNSAAATGQAGVSAAANAGQAIQQGGAASAAAQLSGSNSLANGLASGVNNALYAYGRGWFNGGDTQTPLGTGGQGYPLPDLGLIGTNGQIGGGV